VRNTYLTGGADYSHLVLPRSDASTPTDAAKPITYDQLHASVGAVREVNRIRLSANASFYNYDYQTTDGFWPAAQPDLPQRERFQGQRASRLCLIAALADVRGMQYNNRNT